MIAARLLLVAAALFGALVPALATPRNTPTEIVTWVYSHEGKKENGFDTLIWAKNRQRMKIFSKALMDLWAKSDKKTNPNGDEIGAIDFDLTTSSQYKVVTSFKLKVERKGGNHPTVAAMLKTDDGVGHNAGDETIRYDFVRENGRWLIDDMRNCSKDGWSLRDLLTKSLQDNTP